MFNPCCINCAIDIDDNGYVAIPSDSGDGAYCSEWCKFEIEGNN